MTKTFKVGVWFHFEPNGEHQGIFDDVLDNPEKLKTEILNLAHQDICEMVFDGNLFNSLIIEESEEN